MTPNRHGSAVVELPNDLEIVTTRKFDAPADLVYDVLTQPEHVRNWFAPFEDTVTVCEIDLRVGGDYHIVFVTPEGQECSFRGTYAELDRPNRIVNSWLFDPWGPEAWADETTELSEEDGVTTLTMTVAFRTAAGRANMTMTGPDGQGSSFDKLEDYLRAQLER